MTTVLERVLPFVVALSMVLAALGKLFSPTFRATLSESLGVPTVLLIAVGLAEIGFAWLILRQQPRLRVIGAGGIAVIMMGAVVFNATGQTIDGDNPAAAIPANVFLASSAAFVAWSALGRPGRSAAPDRP
ncbi:MAG: DoxX family protein [Actinomycetota bacterium]